MDFGSTSEEVIFGLEIFGPPANQIGDAIMVRGADARRRRNRSAGRYATGARA